MSEIHQAAVHQAVVRPVRRIGVRELVPLLGAWREGRPGLPGYQALAERLRLLVLDGRLPVHAVLPSERALADAAGTSRTTTTAAYRLLRESGFAVAGHGAGTWTALPGAGRASEEAGPWPVQTSGLAGTPDGRGDLASAAPEAPPQLHAAYAEALADLPAYLPGHGYVTAGVPGLRARIAARYTTLGLPTAPEEVLVTAGAVHGLRLVLDALGTRGQRVLVENPTYPLALDGIRRAGGRPVALPVEDGWDVAAAASALRTTRARLAYLMPDVQNPTGRVLGDGDRGVLARVLADAGCTVIVDETTADLDLRPGAVRPTPFGAFAPRGTVVAIGSASKTFWGGLRVGWVRADRELVRRLVLARASDDLGSPLLEQLATGHLLDRVDEVVADRRRVLAARRRALQTALAVHLPSWAAPTPEGGMVLWCRLPSPSSTAVAAVARSLGVTLSPGPRFSVDGGFESRLRIPFARPEDHLRSAVGLLGEAWRAVDGAPRPGREVDAAPVVV